MNRFRTAAVGTLAVALAAGVSWAKPIPKEHKLTVYADYDGTNITIDEKRHDHAKIDYGDHLVWKLECKKCPDGTKLEIEDIRHLANLGLMEEVEREKYKKDIKAGKKVKPKYKDDKAVYKVGDAFRPGFEKPDNKTVKSMPYLSFDDDHLWKFTWVIKLNGQVEATWDPHFSGSRR